jgi:hypothetical protein
MDKIETFYDHLADFFQFYGAFDFANYVICPFLGRAVPITAFPEKDEDLKKFKDQIKTFNKAAVNVADLLNLNFNVAYGVGKKRARKFTPFCARAQNLLNM